MPTNKTSGPAIILVRPQLGENIGKAARAMLNFGLEDLRLVNPRDGWPNPSAGPSAAGADHVLDNAQIFESTADAIADLNLVFASTVRNRDMTKSVVDLETAAGQINSNPKTKAGILFGREAAGLSNDDIVLADAILTVPVNSDFGSLNLAVAVGLVAYECYRGEIDVNKSVLEEGGGPATKAEMASLFKHIEEELDKKDYFNPEERKPALVTTLRNLLQSGGFNSQQIATLRGIIKALARPGNMGGD